MTTVYRFLKARGIADVDAALLSIAVVAALCVHRDYAAVLLRAIEDRLPGKGVLTTRKGGLAWPRPTAPSIRT